MEIYQGYRVQHHGPTKGGTRFAPSVDIGEVAASAIWMSWKCALAGLPYGGAKGGIIVDPHALSARELEAKSRRYMQEIFLTDVMAPDMGTNEQVMAWFMDTYSMYQGQTINEIVTGKPVSAGGTLGRRVATGRGVAYLIGRALEHIGIGAGSATTIIQGFGMAWRRLDHLVTLDIQLLPVWVPQRPLSGHRFCAQTKPSVEKIVDQLLLKRAYIAQL